MRPRARERARAGRACIERQDGRMNVASKGKESGDRGKVGRRDKEVRRERNEVIE
jgi:hypothetical protein